MSSTNIKYWDKIYTYNKLFKYFFEYLWIKFCRDNVILNALERYAV